MCQHGVDLAGLGRQVGVGEHGVTVVAADLRQQAVELLDVAVDGLLEVRVAAVLLSTVTYALSMVLLRARAQRDAAITIVAIQNVAPALMLAGPAAVVWVPPGLGDWPLLAVIGVLGVAGHLLMAHAYARAEAARLAPLEYTALIWAALLGYAFFGEMPTIATLAGAALIMAGAIVVSRR